MQYTTFTVKEKDYKLRLTTGAIVDLEKKLGGRNPLAVLMQNAETLPSMTFALLTLHAALQKFHHNITVEKVEELWEEYISDGNTHLDIMPVLLEVFEVSGFLPKETQEKEEEEAILPQ